MVFYGWADLCIRHRSVVTLGGVGDGKLLRIKKTIFVAGNRRMDGGVHAVCLCCIAGVCLRQCTEPP